MPTRSNRHRNTRAQELKSHGNRLFCAGNYMHAIRKYEEAVQLNRSEPTYWSNIAACYGKLRNYRKMEQAALNCILADQSFVRGYYRLALAQQMQGKRNAALTTVAKGLSIAPTNQELETLKDSIVSRIDLNGPSSDDDDDDGGGHNDADDASRESRRGPSRTRRDSDSAQLPRSYCCPISLEVMTDPVQDCCGHTYERTTIEEHLRSCGHRPRCPLTNEFLADTTLTPNRALRSAIEEFHEMRI